MARNKGSGNISPTVERYIIAAALESQKPRRALAVELLSRIEDMGEISPGEETIGRMISRARNHEPHPLDNPWSVLSLVDYPAIQPEVVPSILRIYAEALERGGALTNRVALWISRLYYVYKEYYQREKPSEGLFRRDENLYMAAKHYAREERILEIMKRKSPNIECPKWDQYLSDYPLACIARKDYDNDACEALHSRIMARDRQVNKKKYFEEWLPIKKQVVTQLEAQAEEPFKQSEEKKKSKGGKTNEG